MGIAVIGAVFMDLKGYSTSPYIPSGRNAGIIVQNHGGVSRNVAEDIANVELKPTFVSLVDDNSMGEDIIRKLDRHKVNTKYIRRLPDGMGTWLAVFDHKGDVVASVSKRPDLAPIGDILDQQGDEIFKDADSIAVEIDIDKEIIKKIFYYAEKYQKDVYALVSNMTIAVERRDFLRKTSCFVCNQQEAGILFSEDYENKTPKEMADILADRIKSARISRMVVTMGEHGAVYADSEGNRGVEGRCGGHHRSRRRFLCGSLHGTDLWKNHGGGLQDRNSSVLYGYYNVREHLPTVYAGRVWTETGSGLSEKIYAVEEHSTAK